MDSCEYDQHLFEEWRKHSTWRNDELLEYACAYGSFKQFQHNANYFKGILHMCGGLIGITSSILALWTFSNREFSAVSFMYHRVINAAEIPFMVLMIERAIREYRFPAFLHSHSWATYFALFSGKIDNAFPTCVNIITLFISVERTVACLAPTYFSFVNRPRVVWAVVITAIFISIALWTPSSFAHTIVYDNRTEPARYLPVWTEWGRGRGYASYNMIRHSLTSLGASLMMLASLTAVIGLRRTAARNLRRYSSSSRMLLAVMTNGAHGNGLSEYWCLLRQLSYLQLCETVPLIVLHILLVVAESISWDYRGGGVTAPYETSLANAMKILDLAKLKQHTVICLDISNVAAHCFHFYWYLLFCPKVRNGFISCLRNCRLTMIVRSTRSTSPPRSNAKATVLHQSIVSIDENNISILAKSRARSTLSAPADITIL